MLFQSLFFLFLILRSIQTHALLHWTSVLFTAVKKIINWSRSQRWHLFLWKLFFLSFKTVHHILESLIKITESAVVATAGFQEWQEYSPRLSLIVYKWRFQSQINYWHLICLWLMGNRSCLPSVVNLLLFIVQRMQLSRSCLSLGSM